MVVPNEIARTRAEALRYHQAGLLNQAEALYRRILARDPHHADSWYLLGIVAGQMGRHALAAELIGKAIASDGTNAFYYYNLAVALFSLNRWEEAAASYKKAITLKPDYAEAHNDLGVTLSNLGHLEEAVGAHCEAIACQPDFAAAYSNLGNALNDLGRLEEALAACRKAVALNPSLAEAHANLANVLQGLGRLDEAAAAYRKALELKPDYAEANCNLGSILCELDEPNEAAEFCRKAIALKPDYADAYAGLATVLFAMGRAEEAAQACRQAIARNPSLAGAYNTLGCALYELARSEEALVAYRKAVERKPDFVEAQCNLGTVLQSLGRTGEALDHYNRCATTTPKEAAYLINKAVLFNEMGEKNAAQGAVEQALDLNPASSVGWYVRSELKTFAPGDVDIEKMEALLARTNAQGLRVRDRIYLGFSLGKAWLEAGNSNRAFAYLNEANRLKRSTFSYDAAEMERRFAEIAAEFSPERMKAFADAGDPSKMPIFIIGMPRSGSTLIEQILASHPDIHGAGELTVMRGLVDGLAQARGSSYPALVSGLSQADLAALGRDYLEQVSGLGSGRLVADKFILNFLFAGLIHAMLPNARIIHCRRDAMDTCLSCYLRLFRSEMKFAYGLRELGLFYRGYERLMEYWRTLLPPERFCEVRYEDVIDDLETQARRLVDFCGLDWNPACLNFYETRRQIQTSTQVRQPIYPFSVSRWRAYAQHLGPLAEALG